MPRRLEGEGSGEAGTRGRERRKGGDRSVPSGLRLSAPCVARSNLSQHISTCSFTDHQYYSIRHKHTRLPYLMKERVQVRNGRVIIVSTYTCRLTFSFPSLNTAPGHPWRPPLCSNLLTPLSSQILSQETRDNVENRECRAVSARCQCLLY